MNRCFDAELSELNAKILKMASYTHDSIYLAIDALKNRDKEMAKKVEDNDNIIDDMELEIDEYSVALLAKRQPLAIDLRFITTGMKINGELERIADLAVNIAHRVMDLCDQPSIPLLSSIPTLSELAIKMLSQSIDAFVNRDEKMARDVILLDKQANELRNKVQKILVEDYISKDITTLSRSLSLFLLAQHLERICDHAKYISEDVVYLVSAKVVKHSVE